MGARNKNCSANTANSGDDFRWVKFDYIATYIYLLSNFEKKNSFHRFQDVNALKGHGLKFPGGSCNMVIVCRFVHGDSGLFPCL